jgi:hypothetical protein
MPDEKDVPDYQFMSLIYSLSQAIMSQLGKIANPVTGKLQKDLEQAKSTIDMLEMLKEKTKGNLIPTEEKMVLTTLQNAYLNYADEMKSAPESASEKKPEQEQK